MNKPGESKSKYLPFGTEASTPAAVAPEQPWFGPQDLYLFNEGSHLRLHEKFGAPDIKRRCSGFHFAVWARMRITSPRR